MSKQGLLSTERRKTGGSRDTTSGLKRVAVVGERPDRTEDVPTELDTDPLTPGRSDGVVLVEAVHEHWCRNPLSRSPSKNVSVHPPLRPTYPLVMVATLQSFQPLVTWFNGTHPVWSDRDGNPNQTRQIP